MDAATLTTPRPGATPSARGDRPERRPTRTPAAAPRRAQLHRIALVSILLVSFLLRLWGIKQGLPYSYNTDEATHFVPRAIGFFSHDLNPQYFLNPPAYSYLLHIVFELWFGSADAAARAYSGDPASVFVLARLVAAVLGTVSVWLTYLAGARLFDRTVALLAAAILGFAFLPEFYSHLALNDVPTLAPVALSLYGIAGVVKFGRKRDYLVAGLGIGLAAATKYTGVIMLVCLLGATAFDSPAGRLKLSLRRLGVALAVALIAFILANPYSVLDFGAFASGVSQQASLAGGGQEPFKLGTTPGSGIIYYLWTFTWGLGWGPTLAGVGGAILLVARRKLELAVVLLPAPIAYILFMGVQQRFFGRWLLPIFPIMAVLGAYGAVELVRWLSRTRGVPAPVLGVIAAALLLTQSLVAVIHDDAVLSRPDTRTLTRSWMVAHVPAGAKVVLEPVVPDTWASDIGRSLPWTSDGERWRRWPTWFTNLDANGNPLPPGSRRYVPVDEYERALRPALLDQYVRNGYCWVVLGSLQAGRAFASPKTVPSAIAYYSALATRGRLVYHVSPFSKGANSVPFNFDWSIDYYPRQYHMPGPEMSVYHLSGGKCS